jgi:hypothetical protein
MGLMVNQVVVPSTGAGAAASPSPISQPFSYGAPNEGPKSSQIQLTIPANATVGNVTVEASQFNMSQLVSMLVSNEANAFALSIYSMNGLTFQVGAGTTQMLPIYSKATSISINATITTAQARDTTIPIQIFNIYQPPGLYQASVTINGTTISELISSLPAGSNLIGSVGISGALPAGSNLIGSVGISGALPAGSNLIGTVGVSGAVSVNPISLAAAATGGANSLFIAALTNTATLVKAGVGSLKGLVSYSATLCWVQVFDAATVGAVTLGATPPKLSLPIAATSSLVVPFPPEGVAFLNGIVVACTATATGAGAPGAAISATSLFA